MRFKVDENLNDDVADALRARGHDAATVHDQRMRGGVDARLGEACRAEGRAIVTLDLDFANIQDFPPQDFPGLIVLRVADQSRPHILGVIQRVLDLLDREPLSGRLWIVEEHRVRIRQGHPGGQP
jgi:predicted nuclease of predicted toxin-antitoxin system